MCLFHDAEERLTSLIHALTFCSYQQHVSLSVVRRTCGDWPDDANEQRQVSSPVVPPVIVGGDVCTTKNRTHPIWRRRSATQSLWMSDRCSPRVVESRLHSYHPDVRLRSGEEPLKRGALLHSSHRHLLTGRHNYTWHGWVAYDGGCNMLGHSDKAREPPRNRKSQSYIAYAAAVCKCKTTLITRIVIMRLVQLLS